MESGNGFVVFIFLILSAFVAYNVWQENKVRAKPMECDNPPFYTSTFSYKICH